MDYKKKMFLLFYCENMLKRSPNSEISHFWKTNVQNTVCQAIYCDAVVLCFVLCIPLFYTITLYLLYLNFSVVFEDIIMVLDNEI
jgi:hypothetical protein